MTPRLVLFNMFLVSALSATLTAQSPTEVTFVEHDYFAESPERYHLSEQASKRRHAHTYVSGQQGVRQFAQTGLLDTDFFDSGFSLSVLRGPSIAASYKHYLNNSIWLEVRDIGGATSARNRKMNPERRRSLSVASGQYLPNTFAPKPELEDDSYGPIDVTTIQFSFTSPQFLVGQTKTYRYGMIDMSAGIRPWKVMTYNNIVPVTHMELSAALNAYSTVWRFGRITARLFGTSTLDVTIPSRSSEWGMMVGHVPQLRVMVGPQVALSFLRCGFLMGVELGGAEWRMVQDEERYTKRLEAQKRLERTNARLQDQWIDKHDMSAGYDLAARSALSFGHFNRTALKENTSFMQVMSLGIVLERLSLGGYLSTRVNGTDKTRLSGGVAIGWQF